MSELLTDIVLRYQAAPATLDGWKTPALVWELGAAGALEHWEQTTTMSVARAVQQARVFAVAKRAAANTFEVGVTVGRVETNDVVIEDDSISRFHAYLRTQDGTWWLTDAESRHGTWVDGVKVAPNQAVQVFDKSVVRCGRALFSFLLPASFKAMVAAKARPAGVA